MADVLDNYGWVLLLIAFFVIDIPLLFGLFLLIGRTKVRRANSWNVTLGEIVESQVTVTAKGGSPIYGPRIVYEYEVGGQVYRGSKLNFGFEMIPRTRQAMEAYIAPYPVGRRLEVYYNPDNPKQAVLEKTAPLGKNARRLIIIMMLAMLAALVVLAVTFVLIS